MDAPVPSGVRVADERDSIGAVPTAHRRTQHLDLPAGPRPWTRRALPVDTPPGRPDCRRTCGTGCLFHAADRIAISGLSTISTGLCTPANPGESTLNRHLMACTRFRLWITRRVFKVLINRRPNQGAKCIAELTVRTAAATRRATRRSSVAARDDPGRRIPVTSGSSSFECRRISGYALVRASPL